MRVLPQNTDLRKIVEVIGAMIDGPRTPDSLNDLRTASRFLQRVQRLLDLVAYGLVVTDLTIPSGSRPYKFKRINPCWSVRKANACVLEKSMPFNTLASIKYSRARTGSMYRFTKRLTGGGSASLTALTSGGCDLREAKLRDGAAGFARTVTSMRVSKSSRMENGS
jgi:hypothetical protein